MDGFTASLKTCSQMAAECWHQTKTTNVRYWHITADFNTSMN